MRRFLVALALAGALSAIPLLLLRPAAEPPRAAPVPRAAATGAGVMRDPAALASLRRVAAIGAGQAGTLRAAVRRCGARPAREHCVLMALGHAGAGATLNGIILREIAPRLRPGPCLHMADRLAALMGTLAYLASDGVHGVGQAGYVWAAALAVRRLGRRVIAASHGAWPRHCIRIGGLQA